MKQKYAYVITFFAAIMLFAAFLSFGASAETEGIFNYSVVDGHAVITGLAGQSVAND